MKKSFLYTFVVLGVFAIFTFQFFTPFVEAQTPPPAQTTSTTQNVIGSTISTVATAGMGPLFDNFVAPLLNLPTSGDIANGAAKAVVIPLVQTGAVAILKIIQFGMWISGKLFDFILQYTIDDQSLILGFTASIGSAWKIIRDLANIFIVFSLLYLGIKTILNGNGFAEGKVLMSILLAAVLINFSLIFTQTVFNISNVIGSQIGKQIIFTGQSTGYGDVKSYSEGLMGMVRPDNIMALLWNDNPPDFGWANLWDQVQAAVFTGTTLLFMIVIFIGAAILLMYRFIIFIALMIISPVGLISKLIPWFNKVGDWWWNTLKSQAIVLPAFMLTFYISILFVAPLSSKLVSGTSFSYTGITSTAGTVAQQSSLAGGAALFIFNYLLIIGFLLLPLIVPGKIGAAGSSMMTNAADWTTKKIKNLPRSSGRLAGRAALSGTARTGRIMGRGVGNLIGGAEGSDKRKALQIQAQEGGWKGFRARQRIKSSEGLKNQTYDIRSTKLGGKFGMGKGIESWNKSVDSKKKKLEERKKKEEKLFGYDKMADTIDNKIKIDAAKIDRDKSAKEVQKREDVLKRAQQMGRPAAISLARAQLEVYQKELERKELEVGKAKNAGEVAYLELIKKRRERLWNKMSSTQKAAIEKIEKDLEKKWKTDGQSASKKKEKAEKIRNDRDISNPNPQPAPGTPPPTPPAPSAP